MSFCRITGKSRGLPKPHYFPLLPPISPADAKRFCKITGKSYGLPSHHYIPVTLGPPKKKKKEPVLAIGGANWKRHAVIEDFRYVVPILSGPGEQQEALRCLLDSKTVPTPGEAEGIQEGGSYVYPVEERRCSLVFPARLEAAVRDGDVDGVEVSENCDAIRLRLRKGRRTVSVGCRELSADARELAELYEGSGPSERKTKRRRRTATKRRGAGISDARSVFEAKERAADEEELQLEKQLELRSAAHEERKRRKKRKPKLEEEEEASEPTFGHIVQTPAGGLEFVQQQQQEEESGGSAAAIPGQLVESENGPVVFMPGELLDTPNGPHFVPGRLHESSEHGLVFSPGQIVETDQGPRYVAPDLTDTPEGGEEFSVQGLRLLLPPPPRRSSGSRRPGSYSSPGEEDDDNNNDHIDQDGDDELRWLSDAGLVAAEQLGFRGGVALRMGQLMSILAMLANRVVAGQEFRAISAAGATLKTGEEEGGRGQEQRGRRRRRSREQREAAVAGGPDWAEDVLRSTLATAVAALLDRRLLFAAEHARPTANGCDPEEAASIFAAIVEALRVFFAYHSKTPERHVDEVLAVVLLDSNRTALAEEAAAEVLAAGGTRVKGPKSRLRIRRLRNDLILERLVGIILESEEEERAAELLDSLRMVTGSDDPELTGRLLAKVSEAAARSGGEGAAGAIVRAVREYSESRLEQLAQGSQTVRELLLEAADLAGALGLYSTVESLLSIVEDDKSTRALASDKVSLGILKRLVVMRKLAADPGSDLYLRALVRESAALMSEQSEDRRESASLSSSRSSSGRAEGRRRRRPQAALMIVKQGLQVVVPREAASSVLRGRMAYTLVDDRGVRRFEPLHVLSALELSRPLAHRFSVYGYDESVSCSVLVTPSTSLENLTSLEDRTLVDGWENTPCFRRTSALRHNAKSENYIVVKDYSGEGFAVGLGDIVEAIEYTADASKEMSFDIGEIEDRLDSSAARHKLSVRPRRKHADSRATLVNLQSSSRILVRKADGKEGWLPSSILMQTALSEDSPGGGGPHRPEDSRFRREAVIKELVETEEEFGRDLQAVVERYLKPLDNPGVPRAVSDNKDVIFTNLKQIAEFHNTVLIEGVKYYADQPRMLGKTFLRLERDFDKHVSYCKDEPVAQEFLQSNDQVREYFEELSHKLGDDKSISEHLKLPIQRINDYQLLLKELVKYSARLGEDCDDLQKALELMLGIPHQATDNKFISNIEGYKGNIHKLGRLLTHEWFTVTDKEGKSKERYLFLFKARILVCKVRRISEDRSVFLLKDIIRLPEVEVKDHPEDQRTFELHLKQGTPGVQQQAPGYPITLSAHKDQIKTGWLEEIRQHASDVVALAEHAADDLQLTESPEQTAPGAHVQQIAGINKTKAEQQSVDMSRRTSTSHVSASSKIVAEESMTTYTSSSFSSSSNSRVATEVSSSSMSMTSSNMQQIGISASEGVASTNRTAKLALSATEAGKPQFQKTIEGCQVEPSRAKLAMLHVIAGECATFECSLQSVDGSSKMLWLKDNKPMDDKLADRVSVTSDGANFKLKIENVLESDSGIYTARASNDDGQATCTAQLVVQELTSEEKKARADANSPIFLVRLKDTELLENTYLRFMIKVKGDPNPDLKFYKDGVLLDSKNERVKIVREKADRGFYEIVIPDVRKEDAGKYSCVAQNRFGEASCEAEVSVTDEKLMFAGLPEGMLEPGAEPKFVWTRDGVPFDPEERFKVLFKDSEDTLALVFQHVKPEDAGLYTCVAQTSTGNISCSAELTVQGTVNQLLREPTRPVLQSEARTAEVSAGGSAMLDLQVKGYPKPDIKWTKDGEEILAGGRIKYLWEDEESLSLVIKNVTAQDAGVYKIRARNELGADETQIELVVKSAPKITRRQTDMSVVAGESIRAEVQIRGSPTPEVTFYKNNQPLRDSDRVTITREPDDLHVLTIRGARADDAASYSVNARNEINETSQFWDVSVKYPPRISKGLGEPRLVEMGDTLTLYIELESELPATVVWLKGGQVVRESERVSFACEDGQSPGSKRHSMRVEGLVDTDTASYEVEASNRDGKSRDQTGLQVRSAPLFRRKLEEVVVAKEGEQGVELVVEVESFAKPEVAWYYKGAQITEAKKEYACTEGTANSYKLTIKSAKPEVAGVYTCKARNEVGVSECSANVTVHYRPKLLKKLADQKVKEGDTLKLTVQVSALPEPEIKWYKDGQEVSADARIKITRDSQRLENYDLTVTLLKYTDGGVYEVRAQNELGFVTSKSKVIVLTKSEETVEENEGMNKKEVVESVKVEEEKSKQEDVSEEKQNADLSEAEGHAKLEKHQVEVVKNSEGETISISVASTTEHETRISGPDERHTISKMSATKVELQHVNRCDSGPQVEEIASYSYTIQEDESTSYRQNGALVEEFSETEDAGRTRLGYADPRLPTRGVSIVSISDDDAASSAKDAQSPDSDPHRQELGYGRHSEAIAEEHSSNAERRKSQRLDSVARGDMENGTRRSSAAANEEEDEDMRKLFERIQRQRSALDEILDKQGKQSKQADRRTSYEEREAQDNGFAGKPEVEDVRGERGSRGEYYQEEVQIEHSMRGMRREDGKGGMQNGYKEEEEEEMGEKRQELLGGADKLGRQSSKCEKQKMQGMSIPDKAGKENGYGEQTVQEVQDGCKRQIVHDGLDELGKQDKYEKREIEDMSDRREKRENYEVREIPDEPGKQNGFEEGEVQEVPDEHKKHEIVEVQDKHDKQEKQSDMSKEASPIIVSSTLEDRDIFATQSTSYEIRVTGLPRPEAKWFKDGNPLKISKRVQYSTVGEVFQLSVNKALEEDTGVYSVVFTNKLGEKSLEGFLNVEPVDELRRPKLLEPLSDADVDEGKTAVFRAVIVGDPIPVATWKLNGNVIDTEDDRYKATVESKVIEDSLKQCTYKLEIKGCQPDDVGNYTLHVQNEYGEASTNADLNLRTAPVFEEFKDLRAPVGEVVVWEAVIKANPKPKVVWQRDGRDVTEDAGRRFSTEDEYKQKKYRLKIKGLEVSDAGSYKIVASNEMGEASEEAQLKPFTQPPVFTKELKNYESVRDQNNYEAEVRLTGYPRPTIAWLKNGEEIREDMRNTMTSSAEGEELSAKYTIEHFGESDAGNYSCVATNLAGTARCETELSLTRFPPKFFRSLPPSLDLEQGEPLELFAKCDGSPIPLVAWYKDGEMIVPNERLKLDVLPDGTMRLSIDSVRPIDSGAYKVVASNSAGVNPSQCSVAVKPEAKEPYFKKGLEDVKAKVGEPLKLEAQIVAFPNPQVQWLKDNMPLRPSKEIYFSNEPNGLIGLSIDRLRPEDAGTYSVRASNALGEVTGEAVVEVEEADSEPAFEATLQPTTVVEGFPAKLEVKSVGKPKPLLKWTHNGQEVVPDGKHVRIEDQPDGSQALLIDKAGPGDAGEYEVVASNSRGDRSSRAKLEVASRQRAGEPEEPPQFLSPLRDISIEEGKPLCLQALISGNPVPEAVWSLNGRVLQPTDRLRLSCDGRKLGLELSPSEATDSGDYICELRNPLGSDRSGANVSVRKTGQPPVFEQRLADLQQEMGREAKFLARIHGIPRPEISWYFNDAPIQTETRPDKYKIRRDGEICCLYVHDCNYGDCGRYKCRAVNREGTAESEASLSVLKELDKKQKVEPPSFLKRLGDCEVYKGMTAKFTACVTGCPEPEYEWFRDDTKLWPTDRILMENEGAGLLRLSIYHVDEDDAGKYSLRIFNPYGEDRSTGEMIFESIEPRNKRLVDQYTDLDRYKKSGLPLPLADRPIISRMMDRHLTLSWKPSIPSAGQPRLPVTYQVEMLELPDGDWFTARTGVRGCVCDIRNLIPFRDYRFRVRVENKYGVSEPSPYAQTHRARLEPEPPKFYPYLPPGIDFRPESSPYFPKDFDIERPPHDNYAQAPRFLRQEYDTQYGVKNQNSKLFWFVYGYPKPRMSYFFEGEPIESGGRYDYTYTRNGQATLFINKMLERDVGEYEAVATNEHGEARQKVRLEIAEYPTFILRPEETHTLVRKTVRLEARVVGVPRPELKWFKDWKPLAASTRVKMSFVEPDFCSLVIEDVIQKDEGLYSISASNVAGSASSSAMIHVGESEADWRYKNYAHKEEVVPRQRRLSEDYDLGDELGSVNMQQVCRGTQGVVYHAVERATGKSFAAKQMHGQAELKNLMYNELDAMNNLNHRKLLRIHDAYEDTEDSSLLTLITELAAGGELVDNITKNPYYSESDVARYIRQLLEGLDYMHKSGWAHLGLTLGDLLISHPGSDDLKIGDFGLARRIIRNKLMTLMYGMPEFVPPEVPNGEGVDYGTDMWSTGIISYILLSGISPFRGVNDRETLTKIKEGKWSFDEERWRGISDEAKDFIRRLLEYQTERRMDAETALKHPWLKLADSGAPGDHKIASEHLRNYYNQYRDWYKNAACRTWYRRRRLSGAFEHPSKMVYPPGHRYTPEPNPERPSHKKSPPSSSWEKRVPSREPIDTEIGMIKSESHYQNGPDTYLLQLRDTDFPVRLREYMKVAHNRGTGFSRVFSDDAYDWRTPIIRERRRFTDVMDEEIDDERKARINQYGTGADVATMRRLRHELGTRLDSYAEVEAFMQENKGNTGGQLPFLREKPQSQPIREGEPAQMSCLAVGNPAPLVQWFRNESVVLESARVTITEDAEGRSVLKFNPAREHDQGLYKVVARNKFGQTVARARLVAACTPSAPDSPEVADASDTEILLRWKQPRHDGQAPVLCYSLQAREGDAVEWQELADNIDHEFFLASGLKPNTSYNFRLAARNRVGWGEFGCPTRLVKTRATQEGVPPVQLSRAQRHLQRLTESGRPVPLDGGLGPGGSGRPDYAAETNPPDWQREPGLLGERYGFVSEVARGRFSLVAKGIERSTDRVVVAKIFERRPDTEALVQAEFEALRSLRHERVCQLEAAYMPEGSPIAVLVLEKLQGADVLTYLASRHEYSENCVANVVGQVLDALQYLHWRGVCHLDLQPDNVVMASLRSVQVKLVDYGSARRVSRLGSPWPAEGPLPGHPEYIAPEVLNREAAYPQSDIWQLGVLTYVLLSGVSPFRGDDAKETAQNITFVRYRFEYLYKELSQEATRFFMLLFKRAPSKRPTAEECHEHRWLMPTDYMIKKRERSVFLGNRLKEYNEEYHEQRRQCTVEHGRLGEAFGSSQRELARSNSIQDELLTTF